MATSAFDQLLIELLNRARLDPVGEAARLGLSASFPPATGKPAALDPLASNTALQDAAAGHTSWILDTDTFSHQGKGGTNAGDRIENAGYDFGSDYNWAENIAYRASSGTLDVNEAAYAIHRNLFASDDHRINMLDDELREVGVSFGNGDYRGYDAAVVTQEFAVKSRKTFLTGVAYKDRDADDFYSIGEGQRGVTFRIGGNDATTRLAGAYTIELAGTGFTNVAISTGSRHISAEIRLDGGNVKLDLVDGSVLESSQSLRLGRGASDARLLGTEALSLLGNAVGNALYGNSGNNRLEGQDGDDRLSGGAGNDRLLGGAGHDTLVGGPGADTLIGGRGRDVVDYSASDSAVAIRLDLRDGAQDRIIGVEGVIGSAQADWLRGNKAANLLRGGDGDDTLVATVGADTLVGGKGFDTLSFEAFGRGIRADLAAGTAKGSSITGIEAVIGTDAADHLSGADGGNALSGRGGADRLNGRGGADTLDGGMGDDLVLGGSGDDSLTGGAGDDQLRGEAGNDSLHGGLGDDVLSGGRGADVFVFTQGDRRDVITDFQTGIDKLQLDADLVTGDLGEYLESIALERGGALVLAFSAQDRLVFQTGVDLQSLVNDVVLI